MLRKRALICAIYSWFNALPPAPIMMMNVAVIFSSKSMLNKSIIKASSTLLIISLGFFVLHYNSGIVMQSYFVSLLVAIFIFHTSLAAALLVSRLNNLSKYVNTCVLMLTSSLFLTAIIAFVFDEPGISYAWYEHAYTSNVEILRYRGFMYEASHYGLIIAPLLFYVLLNKSSDFWKRGLIIGCLIASAIVTYSLGFFVVFLVSIIILLFIESLSLEKMLRNIGLFFILILIFLLLYFSLDFVSTRIDAIISGEDSSTKGRTVDSYLLALLIADQKSIFWGVGAGQIKEIGASIIMDYYNYTEDVKIVRIPSSAAEMLASYGVFGFFLKIFALIYLYFKFKVRKSRFSNLTFIFFFLYQFVGSFMVSSIEIFCFSLSFWTARLSYRNCAKLHKRRA